MTYDVAVEGLWWRYQAGKDWALRDVSFRVRRGEFLGIVGPSGAGKTTLCMALVGLIPQRVKGEMRGRVVVKGMDTRETPLHVLTERVGLVFQDPEVQFVTMSVEDEVAFPLENRGVPRDEMRRRVREALELVGMLGYSEKYPYELSGGEKQRVAIASLLALRPDVLVLDEPTSDLDPLGKAEVFEVLSRLREEHGITVVLVEHDTELLAEHADRVLVLSEGRVIAEGSPDEVFRDVEGLTRIGVYPPQVTELAYKLSLRGVRLDGLPTRLGEAVSALSGLLGHARARLEGVCLPEPEASRGDVVVRFRGVTFTYPDGTTALRDVSFEVRRGEYVAVIGQNGSGKTTMAKLIVGLLKPTRGVVEVLGRDTRELSVADLATRVGYVYQNPDHQLFCQSVYEEVAYGLRNLGLPEEEIEERVREALSLVGLKGIEDKHPFTLSKGERQRLAVAVVLVMRPEVIIVDEPTTGQDMGQSKAIMRLLDRLNEEGRTVIVITHNMRLVAEHARRVIVMHKGRILADGPVRRVFSMRDVLEEAFIKPPEVTRLISSLLGSGLTVLTVDEALSLLAPVLGA